MNENNIEESKMDNPPEARVRPMRYPFPIIWIVPLIAALCAGYLMYDHYQGLGPKILITFNDVNGLKPGESPVQYRGVTIGKVEAISLDSDLHGAIAEIRLKRSAKVVAKKGSLFWIVRPKVDETNITGLGTVFSGPYIDVEPGSGEVNEKFSGLEKEPVSATSKGLKLLLRTSYLAQVSVNSPVYYRGVQVGNVEDTDISRDATKAELRIIIKKPYEKLITTNTRFWAVSGANVHGSLFNGLDLKVESLRALVTGGIAFATPSEDEGDRVKDGAVFSLDDSAKDEWLEWAPKIYLSDAQLKQNKKEEDSKEAKTIGPALIKREK